MEKCVCIVWCRSRTYYTHTLNSRFTVCPALFWNNFFFIEDYQVCEMFYFDLVFSLCIYIFLGWASSGCGERCRSSDSDGEEAGEREGNQRPDPQVRRTCRTGGAIWWWWLREVLVCLSCWDLTTGLPCRTSFFWLFLYLTYRSSLSFSPSWWRFENTVYIFLHFLSNLSFNPLSLNDAITRYMSAAALPQ